MDGLGLSVSVSLVRLEKISTAVDRILLLLPYFDWTEWGSVSDSTTIGTHGVERNGTGVVPDGIVVPLRMELPIAHGTISLLSQLGSFRPEIAEGEDV